jgi:putative endonuclease
MDGRAMLGKTLGYSFSDTRYHVRMKYYYVYILSSRPYGSLYIGVTGCLIKRVCEHKSAFVDGFTKKYKINQLVYFEIFEDILSAIKHEKRLKQCPRDWKIRLILSRNPRWKDLYDEIVS